MDERETDAEMLARLMSEVKPGEAIAASAWPSWTFPRGLTVREARVFRAWMEVEP